MPAAERIVEISEAITHLSTRHEQLVVKRDSEAEISVPLNELATLILSGKRSTISQPLLSGIMRHGGSVVVCDNAYQPIGLMLPLNVHTLQTERIRAQCRSSLPRCKRLWQQIVKLKVLAQAGVLHRSTGNDAGLKHLATKVLSGDRTNIEGHAAQRYWPRVFSDPNFRRRREGGGANRLLNYGYAVLRAAVGRAICATGLHPSIGLHHRHRNNPWCLADDLMEPYRTVVDEAVVQWVENRGHDCPMNGETKTVLVSALTQRVQSGGETRTLFAWIERTASTLAQAYLEETDRIFYPEGLFSGHKK
ncbi:MAG TPA: type II CRISPR-associated endonuclease Cas1 [Pirellulaceae bacterium]|nr:type II CRISPR-associated endonuclease Cas1 [Pirellulaceae bacterium]HMO92558.1 type II CRISPR-associated endonuclease Cas1 [Pirellulaceae bacterium]HMP70644.1 type II CRISPR-associated endonuclease Cas1 [Pirellulaceae bacterium]